MEKFWTGVKREYFLTSLDGNKTLYKGIKSLNTSLHFRMLEESKSLKNHLIQSSIFAAK